MAHSYRLNTDNNMILYLLDQHTYVNDVCCINATKRTRIFALSSWSFVVMTEAVTATTIEDEEEREEKEAYFCSTTRTEAELCCRFRWRAKEKRKIESKRERERETGRVCVAEGNS